MFDTMDWGLIDFNQAWLKQKELAKFAFANNLSGTLVFCEHPTVITIGRNGIESNVVVPKNFLKKLGIEVIEIDRGGDVTLHNPGQLVGYPIFNLKLFKQDLHWFLRSIEQAIMETVSEFGIQTQRVDGLTGVWVEGKRKICAIGLHCSRWITSHGFALNINNDLNEFNYIVPCGIKDKGVTSIALETGTKVDLIDVKRICEEKFRNIF
jgi:lipoyl(octanoyl) transferase